MLSWCGWCPPNVKSMDSFILATITHTTLFYISLHRSVYISLWHHKTTHCFHFSSVIWMQKYLIYHTLSLHKSTVSGFLWNIVPADIDLWYLWALIEIKRVSHALSLSLSHTHTHTHTHTQRWMGYLPHHLLKSKTLSSWKPLYLDLRDGFGQSIKGHICTSEHRCQFVLWVSMGFFPIGNSVFWSTIFRRYNWNMCINIWGILLYTVVFFIVFARVYKLARPPWRLICQRIVIKT